MGIYDRVCTTCHSPLPSGQVYCSKCGTWNVQTPETQQAQPTSFAPYKNTQRPPYMGQIQPDTPEMSQQDPFTHSGNNLTQFRNMPSRPIATPFSPRNLSSSYSNATNNNTQPENSSQHAVEQMAFPANPFNPFTLPSSPPPNQNTIPGPPSSNPQFRPSQFIRIPQSSSPTGSPMAEQPYRQYQPSAPSGRILRPPFPQTTPSKKFPSRLIALGAAALLLILIVGGGLLLLQPASKPAVVQNANTSTSHKAPSSPAPALRTLFSDDFANNQNNWVTGQDKGITVTLANHQLTIAEANHKVFRELVPKMQNYKDVMVTTTFTYMQGNDKDFAGIEVRGTGQGSKQGYFIGIYGDNAFAIARYSFDPKNTNRIIGQYLQNPIRVKGIHPKGQANTMQVIVKGTHIIVLLNNTVIGKATDPTFTQGAIALFAENGTTSNGIKAGFNTLKITEAPAQLPA